MRRVRTLVKDWRELSPTHKLAWMLVAWEGGRAAIFSAPLNGGVLTIAALLLGTDRYHKRRVRKKPLPPSGGSESTDSSQDSGPVG